ncbi:hypothetical protein [Pseudomonas sp. P9(2020)]|uniref:hypothetical protein n=1 Tax=Pseudomonas sp. P9(2020) TaxID=2763316 RepID=UPI001B338067|nr:hypothetical protein [Pseudomonas sp. P9(2020)]MBP5947955.1 hypothetical protein [Pseudomonas sp. P9(2020)]
MGKKRKQVLGNYAEQMREYKKRGKSTGGRIGLGLESTFKPKKITRDEVVLDAQTTAERGQEKAVLYSAGWSLSDDPAE